MKYNYALVMENGHDVVSYYKTYKNALKAKMYYAEEHQHLFSIRPVSYINNLTRSNACKSSKKSKSEKELAKAEKQTKAKAMKENQKTIAKIRAEQKTKKASKPAKKTISHTEFIAFIKKANTKAKKFTATQWIERNIKNAEWKSEAMAMLLA